MIFWLALKLEITYRVYNILKDSNYDSNQNGILQVKMKPYNILNMKNLNKWVATLK
jgi:hypothetical protein